VPASLPAKFASDRAALHWLVRAASAAVTTIRTAQPADAAFLSQLSTRAFGEYDPAAARTTSRMMAEAGARTLVAERGEQPLGFAVVQPQANGVLALNAIAVVQTERGRGVGRRIMQAVEQYARAHDLRSITLNTAQANLAALDLFLRAGFVITDRSAVRYWRGQPACKLEKRLG
jgi:ribosomal protein S18 acetylase RimI-like enzyme